MSGPRLADFLEHMQQAAADAMAFTQGMSRDDFLADKRTQQAVIMSLIVLGEAATKVFGVRFQLSASSSSGIGVFTFVLLAAAGAVGLAMQSVWVGCAAALLALAYNLWAWRGVDL